MIGPIPHRRAVYPLSLKCINCCCLIKSVESLQGGLKRCWPRGYLWFTHTLREAQCKLGPRTCTNIQPGDIYLPPPPLSPSHWHVDINFCCVSRWIVFKVNLICPKRCPDALSPSRLHFKLPSPGECLCLLWVRAFGHVVNLLER